MSSLRAALVVAMVVLAARMPARGAEVLTFDAACERVIASHPDLAVLRLVDAGLSAAAEQAALAPPLSLALSAENALGTGALSGVDGIELTVSLASIIEHADKRAARLALAGERRDGVESIRAARRLDLLAEVARRYLDAAAARAIEAIALEQIAGRERLVAAAAARTRAGSAPAATHLAATALLARARAEAAAAAGARRHAMRRLAALWGEMETDLDVVALDLHQLPPVPPLEDLRRLLADAPDLRRFAHEQRLREARLQLARSARHRDIEWQLGVRRLQQGDDWGLVGEVGVPLGSAARAQPEVRAADAELAALELEREGAARALQATLVEAWGQLDAAVAEALLVRADLLPALEQAEAAAAVAYRGGALGYLDWAQAQAEILAARREGVEASVRAHRALIELQRLTGEPFALSPPTRTETRQ